MLRKFPQRTLAFAGFVPALHEVVGDIGRCGPLDLGVQVMDLGIEIVDAGTPIAWRMSACGERAAIEIDPSDEGHLSRVSGIDEPTFLVVAEVREVIPADPARETARAQFCVIFACCCVDL